MLEYATRLAKRGHKCTIAALDYQPNWFDCSGLDWWVFPDYNVMMPHLKKIEAKKVATWWKTAHFLPKGLNEGEGYYLVQDIESSYYYRPVDRNAAENTYKLGLKMFTPNKWVHDQMPEVSWIGQAYDANLYKRLKFAYPARNRVLAIARRQALKGFSELGELSRRLAVLDKDITMTTFGRDDRIELVGAFKNHIRFPSDRDVVRLYSEGTAFVSTSQHEGFCSLPDTKVWTLDSGLKRMVDVSASDQVLTHAGNWKKVSGVTSREYSGKMVSIRPVGAKSPSVFTPEHPVFCASRITKNNKVIGLSEWKWKPAGKIEKNDILAIPKPEHYDETMYIVNKDLEDTVVVDGMVYGVIKNQFGHEYVHPQSTPIPEKFTIDEDFMYIAGMYVGDGCISDKGDVIFSLSTYKKDAGDRLVECMQRKFGAGLHVIAMDRNRVCYRVGFKSLSIVLSCLFGRGAHNKTFPMWVFALEDKYKKAFLRGLWDTDGTYCPGQESCRASYSTVSETLAERMSLLLHQMGFPHSVNSAKSRTEYAVQMGTNNSYKFLSHIGIEVDKPSISKESNFAWDTDKYMAVSIADIELIDYSGKVYNLEVDDDHSYCTESFVVHNCLPAVEVMAIGCPLVTTDADGNYFCESGVNCLKFGKKDMFGMAEGVVRLLKDKDLQEKLVGGGLETAKQFANWDSVIDKLEGVLCQA